ncbi:hypothetical protein [Azospirillum sp. SYSU D00513]|uniref:hypothetical protein n=1 Tax=Azospirillum sp. SYSU D00513 TaxID=2812561 RepID=UPI001A96AA81|nr:hypothetical protein [Azospirillum sp. SYSU D00513]
MAHYLVAYDLLSHDYDYQYLFDTLNTVGVQVCDRAWTIAVTQGTAEVRDTLEALAAPGDRLFVATLEDGSWAAANVSLPTPADLELTG